MQLLHVHPLITNTVAYRQYTAPPSAAALHDVNVQSLTLRIHLLWELAQNRQNAPPQLFIDTTISLFAIQFLESGA